MKKHMTRNIILMLVLDVILGIVLALYIANTGTVPAADNADTYTDADADAYPDTCPDAHARADGLRRRKHRLRPVSVRQRFRRRLL